MAIMPWFVLQNWPMAILCGLLFCEDELGISLSHCKTHLRIRKIQPDKAIDVHNKKHDGTPLVPTEKEPPTDPTRHSRRTFRPTANLRTHHLHALDS
eukprot:4957256-Amphidinium_carterae.1